MPKKRTIAVDFDGVIHSYTSPFDRMTLDPPIEGAIPWLEEMVGEFHVVIHSSRFTPHHKDGASIEEHLKEALLKPPPTKYDMRKDFLIKQNMLN